MTGMTADHSQQLFELAQRVRANVPRRDDPEAFHAEKDDIAAQLRKIARAASSVQNEGSR